VPGGNTANGTRVQLWDCLGNNNQSWSIVGRKIRFGNYSGAKCLRQDASNQLVIGDCTATGTDFTFDGNGRIVGTGSRCMDVQAQSDAQYLGGLGLPSNGLQMQFATCNTTLNQQWNASGLIRWGANHSLCLSRKSTSFADPALMVTACGGGDQQLWDYYMVP